MYHNHPKTNLTYNYHKIWNEMKITRQCKLWSLSQYNSIKRCSIKNDNESLFRMQIFSELLLEIMWSLQCPLEYYYNRDIHICSSKQQMSKIWIMFRQFSTKYKIHNFHNQYKLITNFQLIFSLYIKSVVYSSYTYLL